MKWKRRPQSRAPLVFPDPSTASEDGLLAVGGDLEPDRLILAYRQGIFPWFESSPILWFCPDPRLILIPQEFQPSRSLRATIRRGEFTIQVDSAFAETMRNCACIKRKDQQGTWITSEMQNAYQKLHHLGIAHSIETWADNELVGGLYGLAIGNCFFGESMFAKRDNASKVALAALVAIALDRKIELIDCQTPTAHLQSLGAKLEDRSSFLERLARLVDQPGSTTPWSQAWPTMAGVWGFPRLGTERHS